MGSRPTVGLLLAALLVAAPCASVLAGPNDAAADARPVACSGCDSVAPNVLAAFDQTLAKHLAALKDRDLAAYASTLNPDTTLLLPDGKLYAGKAAVVGFHREFLADRNWTQDFQLLRKVVHPHVALVFYRVVYRSRDRHGRVDYESKFFMSLTFARDNAAWRLINDQVTKPR